jgi:opacity protein-like surface antigen
MRRALRNITTLITGLAAVLFLSSGNSLAAAPETDRGEKWEFYIPVRYLSSWSFDGEANTRLEIGSDYGWGFGFGYNLSDHFNLGFEFTWIDTNYEVSVDFDDDAGGGVGDGVVDGSATIGGTLEASSGTFTAQYNFTNKVFTPFVNGGLGWTYVDSNIPTGPAEGVCWWDPWWGYVCNTWQPTATDTSFSYSLGGGLRWELAEAFFLEAAYTVMWIDFDQAGSTDFDGWRYKMGWKF